MVNDSLSLVGQEPVTDKMVKALVEVTVLVEKDKKANPT
jgi:hypothetical protein